MGDRSFGTQLDADNADRAALEYAVAAADAVGDARELTADDVPRILYLDCATLADYPGGKATAHRPLTSVTVLPTPSRRAFGIAAGDDLVAVTYVDIDGVRAETDFTVVARGWRGRELGRAVKAASVLALLDSGVRVFRTGGSCANAGIRAVNASLGYREDEEWVTLGKP